MSDIQSYNLPKNAHCWLRGSPFEPIAVEVGRTLSSTGYTPSTITMYLSCIAHFSHWCSIEHIAINCADLRAVNQFLDKHLAVCRCASRCYQSRKVVRAALHQWIDVAVKHGAIKAQKPTCPETIRAELQALDSYLDEVRGLAPSTRNTRLKHVERFLWLQFGNHDIEINKLAPGNLTCYVTTHCKGWKPLSVKQLCVSLRSYLQFKSVYGATTDKLIASLPKFANWPQTGLPKALKEVDVTTLLESFDQDSLGGQRDYAIARCYVDLGLRTTEIVRLQLGDIDWRQGILSVRGKGRRVDTLPLPWQTGQAIACYLRHRTSQTQARSVFLRLRPPLDRPAASDTIRAVIRNAAKRCGLCERISGPHRFRHTLATRLVQTGASLKDVSDLMRHRNLDTTTIYAKVNLQALLEVASPWPGAHS